jgi:hypothetical protein
VPTILQIHKEWFATKREARVAALHPGFGRFGSLVASLVDRVIPSDLRAVDESNTFYKLHKAEESLEAGRLADCQAYL